MPLKRNTRDLQTARRHLDDARKRRARQCGRVADHRSDAVTPSRAQRLLAVLEKREARARSYLEAIEGWHRKTIAQRVWEMMLAANFHALGFTMTSPDDGPDLRIEHDGRVVWIEAICPTAVGIPEQWMRPLDATPSSLASGRGVFRGLLRSTVEGAEP